MEERSAQEGTESGIPALGPVGWGTHLCQLVRIPGDLAEVAVPFLAAGLARGERCWWLVPAALPLEEALRALAAAVPDLEERMAGGDLEVTQGEQPSEIGDLERRVAGATGFRIACGGGSTPCAGWERLAGERAVALCSCDLGGGSAVELAELLARHDAALVGAGKRWRRLLGGQPDAREGEVARESFLKTLGHDLRNPLNVVGLSADYLLTEAGELSPVARKMAERIQRNAARMDVLIGKLLDMARASL